MAEREVEKGASPGKDTWTIAATAVAILSAALSVAASAAVFLFWGPAYGFFLSTLYLWFFVIPLWAASRFLGASSSYGPTPERAAWVVAVFAVLLFVVGMLWGRLAVDATGVPAIMAGLVAAVGLGLPVALFVLSTARRVSVREAGVIDDGPTRGVWLATLGVVIGLGGLASFLVLVMFSDPSLMTNGRGGFTRGAGAWQWLGGTTATMVVPFLPAWGFGLAQAGLVAAGYARARARRRASVEGTLGRLEDHYALHRVEPDTYERLRALIQEEREGQVPGERSYVEARAATARFTSLGILMIIAALVAVALVSGTPEWNAEEVNVRESDRAFAPCTDCTTDADWDGFLDQVRDWKLSTTLMLTAASGTAITILLVVPRLARDRRAAQELIKQHAAKREEMERRMLEEVRAATGAE